MTAARLPGCAASAADYPGDRFCFALSIEVPMFPRLTALLATLLLVLVWTPSVPGDT